LRNWINELLREVDKLKQDVSQKDNKTSDNWFAILDSTLNRVVPVIPYNF